MSWDLFVLRLPEGVSDVDQLPDDFESDSIGTRASIIEKIENAIPGTDFSDPSWGKIDGAGYSIEVNVGHEDDVTSFALHVRGGEFAICVVKDILDSLGLQAIDPSSPSGLFDQRDVPHDGYHRWRDYRDRVVRDGGP